ncbi:hypothetical protein RJT34_19641 [Clitoria ternatea]|uniref:Uncharacterized protein n=1 Tax=Clitoria ternatea TaxID=43366 RepID=A0AAN9IRF9_CLITE
MRLRLAITPRDLSTPLRDQLLSAYLCLSEIKTPLGSSILLGDQLLSAHPRLLEINSSWLLHDLGQASLLGVCPTTTKTRGTTVGNPSNVKRTFHNYTQPLHPALGLRLVVGGLLYMGGVRSAQNNQWQLKTEYITFAFSLPLSFCQSFFFFLSSMASMCA